MTSTNHLQPGYRARPLKSQFSHIGETAIDNTNGCLSRPNENKPLSRGGK
jgi:hypothetical protein